VGSILAVAGLVALLSAPGAGAQPAATETTASAPGLPAAAGVASQACLACHGLEYLGSVEVDGRTKDLHISPEVYAGSAHADMPCNACHIGFSHENPHQIVTNAEFFAETAGEACRNCHADQFAMYSRSYHGTLSRSDAATGEQAPLCVDCHGNHGIQRVGGLEFRQSVQGMCGQCHGGRESTFLDTYHGKAITLGREAAATCVDCHGAHSILPVSDPESTLSEANILGTCQSCHPEAGPKFTTFLVHVKASSPDAPLVVFAVAMFYIIMIIGVFAFGGIHTLLYIFRGLRDGLYFKKGGGH